MPHVIVRYRVSDYARWRPGYDSNQGLRERYGVQGGRVFRSYEDPNVVFALLEWDNLENARRFFDSDELRASHQRYGVLERPEIHFLEEMEGLPG